MNKNINIDYIRLLLERWSSAETTPAEERLLRDTLINYGSLPDDLEKERRLFLMIKDAAEEEPVIPECYASRISSALEKEMASGQGEAITVSGSAFSSFKKRLSWAISGVAVALAGVFITPYLMNVEEKGEERMASLSMALPAESVDTVKTLVPSLLAKADVSPVNDDISGRIKKDARSEQPSLIHSVRSEVDCRVKDGGKNTPSAGFVSHYAQPDSLDDMGYLSFEEETRLAGKNYRVVRDSKEADRIISSIFSRMENNIRVEDAKLRHVEMEYENVINQTEYANSLNEYNHGIQPI